MQVNEMHIFQLKTNNGDKAENVTWDGLGAIFGI